ncbi:MAG: hypothetical protein WCL18_09490 [bacterium]
MEVRFYIEEDFGPEYLQKSQENRLRRQLLETIGLKRHIAHIIGSDLFPPVNRIETVKFKLLESVVKKIVPDLSKILAIVVFESAKYTVHCRDHNETSDKATITALEEKYGVKLTAQE